MAQITAIKGATWSTYAEMVVKTSGANGTTQVNAATLGITDAGNTAGTTISADGKWTVRALGTTTNDVAMAAVSGATGYLDSGTNNNGNGLQGIQFDARGTSMTGDNDYWLGFWVRAVYDGSTTKVADGGTDWLCLPATASDYTWTRWRHNSAGAGAFQAPGWAMEIGNFTNTGPVTTTPSAANRLDFTGSSSGVSYVPFGKWAQVWLHWTLNASTGNNELYINGLKIQQTGNIKTDGITWSGGSGQYMTLRFPAWAGIAWNVTGLQSYNGASTFGPTITPLWSLDEAESDCQVQRMYLPHAVAANSAAIQGACWISTSTGTATVDSTHFGIGANPPFRKRLNLAGNGNTPTITTTDAIGTLPYNEQGWASVVLSDCYCPSGTALTWAFNVSGDASNFLKLYVTGGKLVASIDNGSTYPVNVCEWNHANRYAIVVNFNRDGRLRVSTIDVTHGIAGGTTATIDGVASLPIWGYLQLARGAQLPDWTPQALGKLVIIGLPTASNVEIGLVAVCKRPSFYGLDSLSCTNLSAPTPNLQTPTCVARCLPYGAEMHSIPGGYYLQQEYGLGRRLLVAALGRSGLTRRAWTDSIFAGLQYLHGGEVVMVDGGSINDLTLVTTRAQTLTNAQLKGGFERLCKWAAANENAVWVGTMLTRNKSVTASAVSGTTTITITATAHGLAATSRCWLAGFGGNIDGYWSTLTVTDANTLTITSASGTGSYSLGTVTGFTTNENAAIVTFNADIRSLMAKYQSKGLFALSDIEADMAANPSNYPNTAGAGNFWQDFTHPNTVALNSTAGAAMVAKRMTQLRAVLPVPATTRRLSEAILGRR